MMKKKSRDSHKFKLNRFTKNANAALFYALAFSMILGCANQAPKLAKIAEPEKLDANVADSSQAGHSQIMTELKGRNFKKTMDYPYLTIRFKQKDAEVEMVLDPLSTNLELDMKRTGKAQWQILKGDSVLTDTRSHIAKDSLNQERNPAMQENDLDDITDEIVRDINLAQELFYQKQYEEALKILNLSLQKKQTAAAYALGGSIYFVNGDIRQAVNAWENALKIDPDLPEVKNLVARYRKKAYQIKR